MISISTPSAAILYKARKKPVLVEVLRNAPLIAMIFMVLLS
jgi:hypothetical protein